MGLFSKLGQSADLVNGMADRLGVDLSGPISHDPEMEAQKYRRAVLRCSNCSNQDGCIGLQAKSSHLDQAPSYCMNTDMFDQIKGR